MHQKAKGSHYFGATGYPVAAVRVRIARGDRVSHPHDLTEVEHEHDFRELVIVERGTALHRLQGLDYRVQRGDVYILQERSRHYFHDIEELDIINIMYDERRMPLPGSQLRQLPGYCALFLLEPQYRKRHQFSSRLQLGAVALQKARNIGEEMIREAASDQTGRDVMLLARLLELMTFLSRQYGKSTDNQSRGLLRLSEVIGSLERDYAHPWTIQQMCDIAHMSRSSFLRAFEEVMGKPPIEFLIERRLEHACRLLRDTQKTVTEIAYETGFSDSNYLARQFRNRFRRTPREYRCNPT